MELYEILSERRRQIGMSMEDLVCASGIAKGTVSKIMAGITRNPQIESLKAITYALGLRLEDLDTTHSQSSISLAAREFAEIFDRLDDHGREIVSAVLDIEIKRCSTARDFDSLISRQKEVLTQLDDIAEEIG